MHLYVYIHISHLSFSISMGRLNSKKNVLFFYSSSNVYLHHQKFKVYIKATVPGVEKESDADYTGI